MRHQSPWAGTADLLRYRVLDGDAEVDVAVVGGGLVGLTTALLAQRQGARVMLLEAAYIGAGTTGSTTGKVTSHHSLMYAQLLERHGEDDDARRYVEARSTMNRATLQRAVRRG